jgi:acetyltransferase-like isoleucine patch superfamily enzyme
MGLLANQYYKLALLWRRRLARLHGVGLGRHVWLASGVDFNLGAEFKRSLRGNGRAGVIELGDENWIERGAVLWAFGGGIRLGSRVFVGPRATIYGHGGVEIGEWSMISMGAVILSSSHTIPAMERSMRWEADELRPTKIGRDVWIGANAVVLGGITLADGVVVGAGSVVTRDVEPGVIVAGVPARQVRKREDRSSAGECRV